MQKSLPAQLTGLLTIQAVIVFIAARYGSLGVSLAISGLVWLGGAGLLMGLVRRISGGAAENCLNAAAMRMNQLQMIVDSVHGCIAYIDAEARYRFVNKTYEQWFGLSQQEIIGRTVQDLLGDQAYAQVRSYVERALAGEIVIYEAEVPYESSSTRYISAVLVPDWGDGCTVQGYYALITDISDQKRIEQALRESEDRYRRIIETANEGVWVLDAAHQTTFVNQKMAAMLGYSPAEMMGRPLLDFIDATDHSLAISHMARRKQGITESHDFKFRRKDGSELWTIVAATPLIDPVKGYQGALGMITDISRRKQAEQALSDSKAKLTGIFENAVASIVQMWVKPDSSWQYEYFSPGCRHLYGYTQAEFLQDPFLWSRCILPEDRESVIAPSFEQVLSNRPHQIEFRFRHKSGDIRWIRSSVNPRWDAAKQSWLTTVVDIDVTEQKRVELALRNSEAKQKAIIDAIPDLLMRVNREGLYLDFWPTDNFRLLRSKHEVVGRKMTQTLSPELGIQRLRAVQAAIDTERMQVYEQVIDFEDDQQVEEVRIVPFGTDEAILLVRDISDRKRAMAKLREREASLRESNRRWNSLLNNVQLIVVELDQQGRIEYANPFFLKLTGYGAEEVLGHSWFEFFLPAEKRPEAVARFRQFLAGEPDHRSQPDLILTKSSGQIAILWNKTRLHSNDGQVIGIISIGEDVTEQYKLELIKAEFISVVSHELRTPLTSVQAALSLLEGQTANLSAADSQQVIAIASQGVDHLVHLVDNILDLRRLESGQMQLEKCWFDLAELVLTAIHQVQEIANQAEITLSHRSPSMQVYGDPDFVLQVLVNLLGNAIKFSPAKTIVLLETTASREQVTFAVVDQGPGIPSSQLDKIFDRFYQVDASDARQKRGAGLGLAICRNIVQQHGGQIWAESCLGEGSRFYFTLPRPEEMAK